MKNAKSRPPDAPNPNSPSECLDRAAEKDRQEKRERYKRQLLAIEREIKENPALFTAACMKLPASMLRDESARTRAVKRLEQVAGHAASTKVL